MSVEVTALDPRADADEWNRYVDRSNGTNPFYRAEALQLQATDTGSTPHLLAGFTGQEPIGLFPVFEYSKGPITGAFSPAPCSWSCYLGPALLNVAKLKRRKADRRTRRFLEDCLAYIDREISPLYARFVTAEFDDVRPFVWNEYTVEPGHTYVVDLEGSEDDLLQRFSSDARSNVRNAEDDAYVVEEGDGDDVGGILVVESYLTRCRWQGGVKPDTDVDVAINDLLDWHVMRDALRDGLERYDLVGAGVPSINRYKAKFNPRLETHYEITAGSFGIDLVVDRYRKHS